MQKQMADFCHWCDKEIIRGSGNHNYQLGNRFCDDDCRSNYHNAKKKVKRQLAAAKEALAAIEPLLLKQGELGQEALAALRLIKYQADMTQYDCYCKNCGQGVWIIPSAGETCNFCQDSNWGFRKKKMNPPVDLRDSKL